MLRHLITKNLSGINPEDVNRFVVVDTETAGLDFKEKNPDAYGVLEVSAREIDSEGNTTKLHYSLLDPQCPICPSASGVHHVTEDHVRGKPTLGQWVTDQNLFLSTDEPFWFLAYNAQFDFDLLHKVIDTPVVVADMLNVARMVYPDAPNHKQDTMIYYLGINKVLDVMQAKGVNIRAHSADGDTLRLQLIIRRIMKDTGMTLKELCLKSSEIYADPIMNFGKHRGDRWDEVPTSYINWYKGQSEISPANLASMVKYCGFSLAEAQKRLPRANYD